MVRLSHETLLGNGGGILLASGGSLNALDLITWLSETAKRLKVLDGGFGWLSGNGMTLSSGNSCLGSRAACISISS